MVDHGKQRALSKKARDASLAGPGLLAILMDIRPYWARTDLPRSQGEESGMSREAAGVLLALADLVAGRLHPGRLEELQ